LGSNLVGVDAQLTQLGGQALGSLALLIGASLFFLRVPPLLLGAFAFLFEVRALEPGALCTGQRPRQSRSRRLQPASACGAPTWSAPRG
jgi:hypothetical protein